MKTLVIGSSGLLGNALISELVKRGKQVKATVQQGSSQKSLKVLKKVDVEIVHVDIRDKDSIEKALDEVEDVYLVAALFKTWKKNSKEFEWTNVDGTRNVLEICRAKSVRRVVYTSSHGIFGLMDYPEYTDESVKSLENQFRGSPYLQSKYHAEQIVQQYLNQGMDIVIVNPAGMIGINDFGDNPTNKYIKLAAVGRMPKFYVNAYVCLVDSRDVALGHILAMEKGKKGERYILGGENITFREYFSNLRQLVKIEKRLVKIPLFMLLPFSYFLKWNASLFSSEPMLTPDSVKFLMKRTRYSSKKAQKELGYQFRPLKESIEDVYQWFKEEMSEKIEYVYNKKNK